MLACCINSTDPKVTSDRLQGVAVSHNLYWPLEPEFAGSNPAEVFGFFGRPENPQYAFLRRGSKI